MIVKAKYARLDRSKIMGMFSKAFYTMYYVTYAKFLVGWLILLYYYVVTKRESVWSISSLSAVINQEEGILNL